MRHSDVVDKIKVKARDIIPYVMGDQITLDLLHTPPLISCLEYEVEKIRIGDAIVYRVSRDGKIIANFDVVSLQAKDLFSQTTKLKVDLRELDLIFQRVDVDCTSVPSFVNWFMLKDAMREEFPEVDIDYDSQDWEEKWMDQQVEGDTDIFERLFKYISEPNKIYFVLYDEILEKNTIYFVSSDRIK